MKSRLAFTLAALAVTVAACGSSPGGGSSPTAGSSPGGGARASVTTRHTSLGTVLATSAGRTIYLLTSDKNGHPTCTGACLGVWPPVIVTGTPSAPSGVSATLAAVSTSGGRQLTVDGRPAYTYAGDSGAGQVNGEGIASFGGIWYALAPNGNPIKGGSPASPSSSSGAGGYGY